MSGNGIGAGSSGSAGEIAGLVVSSGGACGAMSGVSWGGASSGGGLSRGACSDSAGFAGDGGAAGAGSGVAGLVMSSCMGPQAGFIGGGAGGRLVSQSAAPTKIRTSVINAASSGTQTPRADAARVTAGGGGAETSAVIAQRHWSVLAAMPTWVTPAFRQASITVMSCWIDAHPAPAIVEVGRGAPPGGDCLG